MLASSTVVPDSIRPNGRAALPAPLADSNYSQLEQQVDCMVYHPEHHPGSEPTGSYLPAGPRPMQEATPPQQVVIISVLG
ncbi:hypothetical protein NHX12_002423 [Muraenolepis orangiensis]|uniref:Uncharacterized protein n=1 Tax=Muraenolepis orangiensis TaxID=630683 RepID=A0A9Q0DUF4_9TELE|nr:hypothetical protein NHX12_002423 [Muraenolepis orangiensis]